MINSTINNPKFLVSSLSALLFISLMVPIVANAESSKIEQVTIYQGMASVTRSVNIKANAGNRLGEQVVVFSCLSPYVDINSVNIEASSGINLGEVSFKDITGDELEQCNYQDFNHDSDRSIKSHQQKLGNVNAELDAARLAVAFLQNSSKASQINLDGSVGNNAKSIALESARLNKRIVELQRQQAQAQQDLKKLTAISHNVTTDSVMQVSIRTATRQNGIVKINYQVKRAGWEPTYQAHLDTKTGELNITASAVIAQVTGENWIDIPLTLSPVNPNQKATSYLPNSKKYYLIDKEKPNKKSNLPSFKAKGRSDSYAEAVLPAPEPMGKQTPQLPSFRVSSTNKNGFTTYKLPQKISLPSDGRKIQTVIGEQSAKTDVWLRSTPSKETRAYWYASVPFLEPAWVDGSMQLYRDRNYIGQSYYSYNSLKEQGLGFGVDTNLLVKQLSDETKRSDSGKPNPDKEPTTKHLTAKKSYQFTNLHDDNIKLEVLGSEPISLDDNLKTTITHTSPVNEHNWNDRSGIVAWEFTMAPQQTQTVKTEYRLSYPGDKELR